VHWFELFLRLVLAIVVGGLVGLERQIERKPAGLRTHMLVSLGAAIFVLISLEGSGTPADANANSRVIQGIVTGVGFLGAGEIFSKSRSDADSIPIRGLTSAAAIWVSAALGAAVGCGLWELAVMGALLTLLVLWVLKKLERLIGSDL
jgi:putative Mg2+ transporter-C (MgtC) family protein